MVLVVVVVLFVNVIVVALLVANHIIFSCGQYNIYAHLRLLKFTVEFVWVVGQWVSGWGDVQSYFRVKPNYS